MRTNFNPMLKAPHVTLKLYTNLRLVCPIDYTSLATFLVLIGGLTTGKKLMFCRQFI